MIKYRPEIDGLRAIAVLPVMLFHAGFEIFQGGFVGVDVFFVISGYLITSILIFDLESNKYSIKNFYERRARRILPALFFVMIVSTPFAIIWMSPPELINFIQSIVSVSLFGSNFLFWLESGYFTESSELKPFLHTWSLAVEEQFYIFFPIFLYFIWKFGKIFIFFSIISLLVLSFLLSQSWSQSYPEANFYLAPSRIWELLVGSCAALFINKNGVKDNNFLSALGIIAIFTSVFLYNKDTPFPSIYTLLPVLGVLLIIIFSGKKTFVNKLLSFSPLVGIGLISYSAYLWHQPIFAFAKIRFEEYQSDLVMVQLIFLSLLLAYFSWNFIEAPFRNRNFLSQKKVFIFSSAAIFIFVFAGLTALMSMNKYEKWWISNQTELTQKTYAILYGEDSPKRDFVENKNDKFASECRFLDENIETETQKIFKHCHEKYGPGALIIGDSHAMDIFGSIISSYDDQFIVAIAKGSCRPSKKSLNCPYEDISSYLSKNTDIFKSVIFHQAGFYLYTTSSGKPGTRASFIKLDKNKAKNLKINTKDVESTINYLNALPANITIKWLLPRYFPNISKASMLAKGCDYSYRINEELMSVIGRLNNNITSHSDKSDTSILYIDSNKYFNFSFPEDFMNCEKSFWDDNDHFNEHGEVRFGKRLPADLLD